ncbi:Arm DNA-binding domain-containing protein [Maritalea myrionectae]|uniref:Arm DNA-binding domain-containing protein n=1 Tax=Maritalea myrionectae TaxID=454601 RepID=UPI000E3BA20B
MILTDTKLKKISPKFKPVADVYVQGLYFYPSATKVGNGKWLFRYTSPLTRKRREMGLGKFPEKSLKDVAGNNCQLVTFECEKVQQRARSCQPAPGPCQWPNNPKSGHWGHLI